MMLDLPQVAQRISGFATAFRLETLDVYTSASDGGDVARYLAGEPAPDPERKQRWLSQLRDECAQGRVRQRVHVLTSPIGPYLRYECEWGYAPNTEAGEDVRILDLAERPRPPALDVNHDFWLINDQDVIRMHYDTDGRFTAAEVADPGALLRYRAARDAALVAAESFTGWWRRHPEYYQVNNQAAGTSP
jgi:hypothetical protein